MSKTMTVNVRIGGVLGEFVDQNTGENGQYDNASEYVRDLIRRDKEKHEAMAFATLKAELEQAFGVPETDYVEVSASDIIKRHS